MLTALTLLYVDTYNQSKSVQNLSFFLSTCTVFPLNKQPSITAKCTSTEEGLQS